MRFRLFVVTVILSVILSTAFSTALAANVPGITPQYTYTSVIKSSISVSGKTATAAGSITPKPYNRKTFVKVQLQKKENGSWTTIASWTESNNNGVSSAMGSKTLTKGKTYRTYTTGKVYDSSGNLLETVYKASSTYSY